jgi:Mu-like prophage protein gp36
MATVYVTEQDLKDRFGDSEVGLLAELGPSVVAKALADASEEAESYVAVNYTPPLPNIPAPLRAAAADIARYRLYKDRSTEEVKYRYEKAVEWLVRLSKGTVKLTFDPALTVEEKAEVVTPAEAAVVGHATGGIFSSSVFDTMPLSDPELSPTRSTEF